MWRAEELLRRAADDEAARTNAFQHVLGLGASAGLGLVIALILHDPLGGVLNGAASVAACELNLWTSPTGAADAIAGYKNGRLVAGAGRGLGFVLPLAW